MIGRNIKFAAWALAAATTFAASPMASAQEAIMLERIGAVRMATPAELQAADQGRSVATTPQHETLAPSRIGPQRVGAAD